MTTGIENGQVGNEVKVENGDTSYSAKHTGDDVTLTAEKPAEFTSGPTTIRVNKIEVKLKDGTFKPLTSGSIDIEVGDDKGKFKIGGSATDNKPAFNASGSWTWSHEDELTGEKTVIK